MLKISIEYCAVWNYTDRAISLMVELVKKYEREIEAIELIPAGNGKFEIMVNDNLIFSKKNLGRHAEDGEIDQLIESVI